MRLWVCLCVAAEFVGPRVTHPIRNKGLCLCYTLARFGEKGTRSRRRIAHRVFADPETPESPSPPKNQNASPSPFWPSCMHTCLLLALSLSVFQALCAREQSVTVGIPRMLPSARFLKLLACGSSTRPFLELASVLEEPRSNSPNSWEQATVAGETRPASPTAWVCRWLDRRPSYTDRPVLKVPDSSSLVGVNDLRGCVRFRRRWSNCQMRQAHLDPFYLVRSNNAADVMEPLSHSCTRLRCRTGFGDGGSTVE